MTPQSDHEKSSGRWEWYGPLASCRLWPTLPVPVYQHDNHCLKRCSVRTLCPIRHHNSNHHRTVFSRSEQDPSNIRFQITIGGWQNVGTVSRKYPTLSGNMVPWYKSENPYYSQKMLQFPRVDSGPILQTLWCERCLCTRTPLQLNIGPATEHWPWYKQKLQSFIGNSITEFSDVTENFVRVCKTDRKPTSIYWKRTKGSDRMVPKHWESVTEPPNNGGR